MEGRNKKIAVVILLLLIAAVSLKLAFRQKDLGEYKKTVEVKMDASAQVVIDKLLANIEKDDMNAVFQMMFSSDYGLFYSNYVKGVFAEKDFMPVKFTGQVREVAKSSSKNLLVEVYSEKRAKKYWISLVDYKGEWRVAGIGSFELPKQ